VLCEEGHSLLEWDCLRQRLTLGATCILAAGCYVDDARPREERRTRGDSVLVRIVVRIVRTLRGEIEILGFLGGNEVLECADNASTFLWLLVSKNPGSPKQARPRATARGRAARR